MADYKPQMTTPSERTDQREQVYQAQKQMTEQDLEQQQAQERANYLRSVAQKYASAGPSPVAQQQAMVDNYSAGKMIPVQQQSQRDEMNLTGTQMGTDIGLAQKEQRAKNFQQTAGKNLNRMALNVAQRAMESGYSAKMMALHDNAAISDLAFQQMQKDFEAGRVTEREILTFQRQLRYDAQQLELSAKSALKEAMLMFQADMKAGNIERAKSRIMQAMEASKAASKRAAQAANTGAIITGGLTVLGGIGGFVVGGPAGAVGGATAGNKFGQAVS